MTCRKVTRGESDSKKEGGTMGQDMREVDATGGKMKGRKEMRVDVTKRKLITGMMTGRKHAGKKGTTEKAATFTTAAYELSSLVKHVLDEFLLSLK